MEGDNRRTSVYDLTGLRLHPDGSRVHQTQRNLRFGAQRRHTTQDSRGWIADDAGGSVIMPQNMRYQQTPPSDLENLEMLVTAEPEPGDPGEGIASVTGKRYDRSNIRRALKRKEFAEDDNYISSLSRPRETSNKAFQMPSQVSKEPHHIGMSFTLFQDLLKNIHHLAASYYDRHGQLINASKRYREAKKLRKLRRHKVSSEPALIGVQVNEDGDVNGTEEITMEDDSAQRRRKVNRDMYRVLDGSVLVAIGIFTEEIVKKLLQGRDKMTQRQIEVVSSGDEASRSDHGATLATRDEGSELNN